MAEWRASVEGKLGDWLGLATGNFFSCSLSAAVEVLKVPAELRLQRLEELNRKMKDRKLRAKLLERPELKHFW